MIPQEFVGKYNLKEKAHNGKNFSWVTKWVYVLPQSGKIAYDALFKKPGTLWIPTLNKNPRTMDTL